MSSPSKSKIHNLNKLHQQLISHILKKSPHSLVSQTLNLYAETLIKEDKTTRQLFDKCCELGFYQLLQDMFNNKNYELEVLQTISLLLINLQHKQSISFLLSHKLITHLITDSKNTKEESLEYYISFLKTLSLRITSENISLFYNQKYYKFPLAEITIKYYNHNESLIRTSCMNIIFTLMKIKSKTLQLFFTSFPYNLMFVHLVCYLKSQWIEINQNFNQGKNIESFLEDQKDHIILLHDMMKLDYLEITIIIKHCIMVYLIKPILKSLLLPHKSQISMILGLYLLLDYLIVFKQQKDMVQFICLVLFYPKINTKTCDILKQDSYVPKSYSFDQINKYLSDNHEDDTNLLYRNLINLNQDKEDIKLNVELMKQVERIADSIAYNLLKCEKSESFWFYQKEINKNNSIQSNSQFIDNPIKQIMYSLLKTKDDLMLQLITKVILYFSTNKYISRDILLGCNLLLSQEQSKIDPSPINQSNLQMLSITYLQSLSSQMLFRTETLDCIFYFLNILLNRSSVSVSVNKQLTQEQTKLILENFNKILNDLRKICKSNSKIYITYYLQQILFKTDYQSQQSKLLKICSPNFSGIEIELDNNQVIIQQLVLKFCQFLKIRYSFIKQNLQSSSPSHKNTNKSKIKTKTKDINYLRQIYLQNFNNYSSEWKIGNSTLIENRNLIECYNKNSKVKNIIVNDDMNFILVKQKQNHIEAVVLMNAKYKNVEVQDLKATTNNSYKDKDNDNVLVVKVRGRETYVLEFQNQYLTKVVKNKIKESRENCVNQEIMFLLGYIQDCFNDL